MKKLYFKTIPNIETPLGFHIHSNPAIEKANEMIKMHNHIRKGLQNFKRGLNNIKYLVAKGWYISPKVVNNLSLNTISELKDLTKKSNVDEFEQYIISSFDERQKDIFDYLRLKLQDRMHIIEEIETLYKQNLYTSLITLCYSQADGICNDFWKIGFFDSENKKNGYELKVKKLKPIKPIFSNSLVNQLKQPKNEITRSSYDSMYLDPNIVKKSINRHLVIHGHSINFGNKENAMRAILLLEFICHIKEENFTL